MKKKKKGKRSRLNWVISVLLLTAGVGVIAYPTLSDMYINYKLRQEISEYNNALDGVIEDYSPYWEKIDQYNEYLVTKDQPLTVTPEENEYASNLLNPLKTGMMGSVEIPRIGVNIPIFYGTNEEELQAGAGFWPGSSIPAGGASTHTVLTAHTGLVRAKLFTDIDKLENGDLIYIKALDRLLTYEVDQQQIIEPNNMEPLMIQPGMDLVTLYTCYPYGVNSHRLLVRGHRIPNEEKPVSDIEKMEELIEENPYLLIIPAVLLPVLIWWMIRRNLKRKAKKKDNLPLPLVVDTLQKKEKPQPGWIRTIPVYLRKDGLRLRVMKKSEAAEKILKDTKQKKPNCRKRHLQKAKPVCRAKK